MFKSKRSIVSGENDGSVWNNGMSLGTMGFIFGMNALTKVDKLEKKLKEPGVLKNNTK